MIVAGERGNVCPQSIVLRLQHQHEAAAARCEECLLAGLLHEHGKPWHSAPFPGTLANLIDGVATTSSPPSRQCRSTRLLCGLSGFRRRSLGSRRAGHRAHGKEVRSVLRMHSKKDLQSFHCRVAASHITRVRYKRSAIVLPRMICSPTVLHCVQKICNRFAAVSQLHKKPKRHSKDLQSFRHASTI